MIITFFPLFSIMLYVNKKGRISAQYPALPAFAGLPPIPRSGTPRSGESEASSECRGLERDLERAAPYLDEGCMVTKHRGYFNRLLHLANALSPKDKVSPDVVSRLFS
jgi:hypothetical protein